MEQRSFSRRDFIGKSALGAVGAMGVAGLAAACSSEKLNVEVVAPLKKAIDGEPIKAGVIGCGGRGTGAAINFLNAGAGLEIVALGDVFEDRIAGCREQLMSKKGVEVADEKCFVGFDAFQKVLEQDINYVIIATPPHFRPEHVEAAVKALKHVFMEKPVAVDPVGARRIIVAGKQAESLGLCVVAGTQRRHQWNYQEIYEYVKAGAIGKIVSANVYWNGGKLWHVNPRSDWSEMEAMIRNWVNWMWLSGDHIVEQHVHNIDVVNWFKDAHPVKALGFGSRQRRITGDQFDNFSVDFVYDDGTRMHSMCRQINGCDRNVSEHVVGEKGYGNPARDLYTHEGELIHKTLDPRPEADEDKAVIEERYNSPYDQEHIDLITAIRRGEPINEAEHVATSTLTAIMGRTSAYTGKEVTWDEMMNSEVHYMPAVYDFGDVTGVPKEVPVPGEPGDPDNVRRG